MKKETVSDASATVKDFSNGQDGSKEVDLTYSYDYDVLENDTEVREKFSPEGLRDLCNARLKSTANSAARQKAIAPYAQDPNSPAAIRENLIKNAMKIGKTLEQATAFVDSLFAS